MKTGKDILFLSILTLITVLSWIALDVYNTLTKIEIPQILQKQILPLNPTLSKKTLSNLENRLFLKDEEINSLKELENESTQSGLVSTDSNTLE